MFCIQTVAPCVGFPEPAGMFVLVKLIILLKTSIIMGVVGANVLAGPHKSIN